MDRAARFLRLGELYQELAEHEQALGLARGALPDSAVESPVGLRAYDLVAAYGSDLISIHSAGGDYLFVSPNCTRLFGYAPTELKGRNAYEFFHKEDLAHIAADHASQGTDGHAGKVRYRFLCRDGTYRWVETRSQSRLAHGKVEQIIAITRDIQEEVQAASRARDAEQELARAQQLASIGRLAGAVGHELASPLTASIMGLDALLLDSADFAPHLVEALEDARQGLARSAAALAELRLLARERREHADIDLAGCVRDVLRVAALRLRDNVDVSLTPVLVSTDPARCHQLVYNMLTAHLGSLPASSPTPAVRITCGPRDAVAELAIESAVQLDRQVMVADLVSALRGQEGRYEVPLALAREIAGELGADWQATSEDGLTTTAVRFARRTR